MRTIYMKVLCNPQNTVQTQRSTDGGNPPALRCLQNVLRHVTTYPVGDKCLTGEVWWVTFFLLVLILETPRPA